MTTVEFIDLIEVGALNDGDDVFFRGKAADGSDVRVILPHGHLGKLITYLYQAGAIAERERGDRPVGEFTTTMLNPVGIGVHPMTDGSGRVAIEIGRVFIAVNSRAVSMKRSDRVPALAFRA